MQVFYSANHSAHNPPFEIYDGEKVPFAEVPDRLDVIAERLTRDGHTMLTPMSFPEQHIYSIHQTQYVDFVRTRSKNLTKSEVLYPSYFMSDTYAPLTSGTFTAAKTAVDTALSGAKTILDNDGGVAYSLCRPPGHHAEPHSMGGYCYFNNAAIAANYLSERGRVAILDIDYHHGNGTQDIFYDRDDVLYVSLHADPESAYPYISGYATEKGRGKGQGFTLNIPLQKNTDNQRYLDAMSAAIKAVTDFKPDYLLVSLGYDTFIDDPIGALALTKDAYEDIGSLIASISIPTLLLQEGGYNVEALPELASRFLKAFG